MSMVYDMLFNFVPPLPEGKTRKNFCLSEAVVQHKKGQAAVKHHNTELVFQAIAKGHDTNEAIQADTGLAKTTVLNATVDLLRANRITADKSRKPSVFKPVKDDEDEDDLPPDEMDLADIQRQKQLDKEWMK
jgi:hypothetical protein